MPKEPMRKLVRLFLYPLVVAAGLLLLTVVAAEYSRRAELAREQAAFRLACQRITGAIEARVSTYIAVLEDVRAHLATFGRLTEDDFYRYAGELALQKRYPGIQGVGVTVRVRPDERAALVEKMREEGQPDFTFHPAPGPDEIHAIIYLYPPDRRNRVAIGYDMFSEEVRRKAMERARDTAAPAASGRVTLVQEIDERKQAGFLMYVPFYEGWKTPETVESRREKLVGFVYSPFRANDLLEGIFGPDVDPPVGYRIEAPGTDGTTGLLHDSEQFDRPLPDGYEPRLSATGSLSIEGTPWQVYFYTRPPFDSAGAPTHYWFIIAIGGLFSATLSAAVYQRMHYWQQLAISESRFRLMADSAPVLIWMSEAGKGRVWFNQPWLEFTGRSLDQEREDGWTAGVHPDDREICNRTFTAALETGSAVEMDYRLRRRDGRYAWILDRGVPIDAAAGTFHGLIGSCVDITERKEAEERRERVLEEERRVRTQAEEAGRLKDEFLATLSHELRTPLNAIQGWVQLLLRRFREPVQLRDGLEIVERNVRAQTQIVDDLLDMNRIVSGKVKLERQVVRIDEVVRNAIDTVRPAAAAKQITVTEDFPATEAKVYGDAGRLQQVFWNLMTNAVKFTPPAGKVAIAVRLAVGRVEVSVRDTGEGISLEFLPQVFDRFRQADASSTRRHGGLGLGLAISKQLISMHHGEIAARSEGPGSGAEFIVTLPLVPVETAFFTSGRAHAHSVLRMPPDEIDLQGTRLLVVDDDADSREMLRVMLIEAGATVSTCASVDEAILQIEQEPWDALISDIAMPDIDGHELVRMLRRHTAKKQLPAIAVTAFARGADKAAALEAGYDCYLAKPIERGELLQTVAMLVGKGRAIADRAGCV